MKNKNQSHSETKLKKNLNNKKKNDFGVKEENYVGNSICIDLFSDQYPDLRNSLS